MRKEEKLTIVSWKEAMSNTKCQKVFTYITFSLTKWQIIKQNLNIKFYKNSLKYIFLDKKICIQGVHVICLTAWNSFFFHLEVLIYWYDSYKSPVAS